MTPDTGGAWTGRCGEGLTKVTIYSLSSQSPGWKAAVLLPVTLGAPAQGSRALS